MQSFGNLPNLSSDHHEIVQRNPINKSHQAVDEGAHVYKCAGSGDIRSVCPALNTLANHSYLPHDGRNISFSVLSHALQAGYGISPVFADFLVFGSYILLRRSVFTPLNLHEIDQHNRIEHNASVVHDDDTNGSKLAPMHVDPNLLHKFLSKAYSPPSLRSSGGSNTITVEDIAHTRVAREAATSAPPDALHAEIARGEFAMVLNIFGKGPAKTLSAEDLELWLNENRFPPHWTPTHQENLLDTVAESTKMRKLMEAYQGEEPHETLSAIHEMVSNEGNEVKGLFTAIGKTMESLVGKFEKMTHPRSPDVSEGQVQETTNL